MAEVGIDEQIQCVERELAMRRRVYPRWVRSGKLLELNAVLELMRMEAVLETLKRTKVYAEALRES